jgi:hypothetical protein
LVSGGALVSVACRPGGGVTIALSGLPAPADGQAAGLRFASGGGGAVAQMRWRASAGGYELDGASRPNEARAVLDRLRAGGLLTISGAGGSKSVPAPGSTQINRLVSSCGSAPVAAPASTNASVLPRRPVTDVKPKPRPQGVPPAKPVAARKTETKVVTSKAVPAVRPANPVRSQTQNAAQPKPPPPKPKAIINVEPKPKPKTPVQPRPQTSSEAAPPRAQ